jgi:hypothetical protein
VRELNTCDSVDARHKENNDDKIIINNVQTLKFGFFFFSAYRGICGILLTVSSLPYVEEELQFEA